MNCRLCRDQPTALESFHALWCTPNGYVATHPFGEWLLGFKRIVAAHYVALYLHHPKCDVGIWGVDVVGCNFSCHCCFIAGLRFGLFALAAVDDWCLQPMASGILPLHLAQCCRWIRLPTVVLRCVQGCRLTLAQCWLREP